MHACNLTIVTTKELDQYSYPNWQITETGTYEIKASWEGDTYTIGSERAPAFVTARVKVEDGEKNYDLFLYAIVGIVAIVGMVIVAAITIYLIKLRKPK